MDYTKTSKLFQLHKVVRYVRMYGPRRTLVKVLGHVHMKRKYRQIPPASSRLGPRQTVALIGCGNYAYSNIAYYLCKEFGNVIGACMDIDADRAASLAAHYAVPLHTTDSAAVIDHPQVQMVYIASNHASHAEYAIAALKSGKSVYIEKPHVVSEDQLRRLASKARDAAGRVYLGFNRPGSRFGQLILEHLANQQGPGMYNWFVAGHAIDPDHWYFQPQEGGRVLGNLCHWTDFVLMLAGEDAFPVEIRPTRGRKSDSDIAVTYTFQDETVAVITFSTKGHTFEGVSEAFHGHRGNCLVAMQDYHTLTIDLVQRQKTYRNLFRDHGHCRNITAAYRGVHERTPYDSACQLRHMCNSAWLFLSTKRALEENRALNIGEYDLPVRTVAADAG